MPTILPRRHSCGRASRHRHVAPVARAQRAEGATQVANRGVGMEQRHLSSEELGAMLDRRMSESDRAAAERHLASCAQCRDAFAALAGQDAALRRTLTHDPGAAYFESFADRVENRI